MLSRTKWSPQIRLQTVPSWDDRRKTKNDNNKSQSGVGYSAIVYFMRNKVYIEMNRSPNEENHYNDTNTEPEMQTSISCCLNAAPAADDVDTVKDAGWRQTTLDRPWPLATTWLTLVTLNLNGLPTDIISTSTTINWANSFKQQVTWANLLMTLLTLTRLLLFSLS